MNDVKMLQSKLVNFEEMSHLQAAIAVADIMNYYDEDIKQAIIDWAYDKDVSDFEQNGIKVSRLVRELRCDEYEALCVLNGIMKNPKSFKDLVLVQWRE